MTSTRIDEPVRCRIALIAHDHKKADLRDWARFNRGLLARHGQVGKSTGRSAITSLPVHLRDSGGQPTVRVSSFGGHDAG
jgi:methylglyoxal synthase